MQEKKPSKDKVRWHLHEIQQDVDCAGDSLRQLPKTPGRDRVERGLQEVREGLGEIKREADLK
jgi:hypothetical protein